MSNPKFAKIGDKLYKINTDFRVALRCEQVGLDDSINDTERALAIIFLLFGDEGISHPEDYEELLKKATTYLSCGREMQQSSEEDDIDFEQDKAYIKASFYTDYNIPDIYSTNMHWYDFVDLMNGLKEDCVLNRVREIRNYDLSQIKDPKMISQIRKQKEAVAIKKKQPEMTDEQIKNYDYFMEQMHLK